MDNSALKCVSQLLPVHLFFPTLAIIQKFSYRALLAELGFLLLSFAHLGHYYLLYQARLTVQQVQFVYQLRLHGKDNCKLPGLSSLRLTTNAGDMQAFHCRPHNAGPRVVLEGSRRRRGRKTDGHLEGYKQGSRS